MSANLYPGLKLTIDFEKILNGLPHEQRAELVRSACFESSFIQNVCEMVATGVTSDGSWFDSETTNRMRLALMPLMADVAREAVGVLMQQLAQAKLDEQKWSDWAWGMYRRWPDDRANSRPDFPKHQIALYPADKEIDSAMSGSAS
ncbi:hypothetical protein PQQ75_25150 [Paraburkholderia aspalathi]|uniref:hypothetical protein n=1 Tax=Paraburkholderia aspalathi TaxID=1324617 RepID=UPI0038BD491B